MTESIKRMKSQNKKQKESVSKTAETLSRGGRATIDELKEIANSSVIDFLQSGLTLEQANTVMTMAKIEISRLAGEAQWGPRTPAVEVKIKGNSNG
jgi:hypothetical protein